MPHFVPKLTMRVVLNPDAWAVVQLIHHVNELIDLLPDHQRFDAQPTIDAIREHAQDLMNSATREIRRGDSR